MMDQKKKLFQEAIAGDRTLQYLSDLDPYQRQDTIYKNKQ
jgi:hypothetical protein